MPDKLAGREAIESALAAVGELLDFNGSSASIVVVGGAALNLLGVVNRATIDVDVLARGSAYGIEPPDPFPPGLVDAIRLVAIDRGLLPNWMNTAVAGQWAFGLPPGLGERVHWRVYGGLRVGVADRRDLVFFKLYASGDQATSNNVHTRDLLALKPSDDELAAAASWVAEQDPSTDFHAIVRKVVDHVRTALREAR